MEENKALAVRIIKLRRQRRIKPWSSKEKSLGDGKNITTKALETNKV